MKKSFVVVIPCLSLLLAYGCSNPNMKELDELNAMKTLIKELGKGEVSAKEGWISLDEVEKRLGL